MRQRHESGSLDDTNSLKATFDICIRIVDGAWLESLGSDYLHGRFILGPGFGHRGWASGLFDRFRDLGFHHDAGQFLRGQRSASNLRTCELLWRNEDHMDHGQARADVPLGRRL